jgi:hypothetical protein
MMRRGGVPRHAACHGSMLPNTDDTVVKGEVPASQRDDIRRTISRRANRAPHRKNLHLDPPFPRRA